MIGVFGLGYIGLPRCIQFARKGFKVIGFDIDLKKIKLLKSKKSYLTTIEDKQLNLIKQNLNVTNDFLTLKS